MFSIASSGTLVVRKVRPGKTEIITPLPDMSNSVCGKVTELLLQHAAFRDSRLRYKKHDGQMICIHPLRLLAKHRLARMGGLAVQFTTDRHTNVFVPKGLKEPTVEKPAKPVGLLQFQVA